MKTFGPQIEIEGSAKIEEGILWFPGQNIGRQPGYGRKGSR